MPTIEVGSKILYLFTTRILTENFAACEVDKISLTSEILVEPAPEDEAIPLFAFSSTKLRPPAVHRRREVIDQCGFQLGREVGGWFLVRSSGAYLQTMEANRLVRLRQPA